MLVPYRQDREQQHVNRFQATQTTTRCLFLTNNTQNNHVVVCKQRREQRDDHSLQKDNKLLAAYKQRREHQDASSLQDRTEINNMLVAYRQHREQRDAASLQRGYNLFLFTNKTENNKTLVPYRTGQTTRKC